LLRTATSRKVSVIVPNYNYARYIEARLTSIEAQSFPVHEVIFLDDASTDESLALLDAFRKKSRLNIVLHTNRDNSGSVFRQWVKGIEMAEGEYIWIAEADDLSDPAFLECVMKGFDDPNVVLSYALSRIIGPHGEILQEDYRHATDDIDPKRWLQDYIRDGKEEIADTFVVKNSIPNVSSAVFKKTDISSIREKLCMFTVAGDWYFYYHLLQQGKIAYCARPLNLYRRHNSSVVSSNRNNRRHYEELMLMQHLVYRHFPVTEQSWEVALSHRLTMKKWLKIYHENLEKYLFIITYGESGAEKLTVTLNRLPEIDIRGENMGVLSHLYQAYTELSKAKGYGGESSKNPADPWYGIQNVNPYLFAIESCALFVEQVLQPAAETKVSGFKEIRFLNRSWEWMDGYVDFLLEFFPNSTIVFYHADIKKVAHTGFWRDHPYEPLLSQLEAFEQWMYRCQKRYPTQTLALCEEDLPHAVERLKKVLAR